MHNVFVYGTLMDREVVHYLLGKYKTTYSDTLKGYKKLGLNIVKDEQGEVNGVYFEVDKAELEKLDAYEGIDIKLYSRTQVELESGERAWVYQKVNPEEKVYAFGQSG